MNNNNQTSNDADSEDDFPVCQAPSINQDNHNSSNDAPPTPGRMGMMFGGMGKQSPKAGVMNMGIPFNTTINNKPPGMGVPLNLPTDNNKPLGFGGCCGPPRTMNPMTMGPMGITGPIGSMQFGLGQRNPPSYQDFTQSQQNNRNGSHINDVYSKLAEARKKIAELNKFIDEIYETLPKIK